MPDTNKKYYGKVLLFGEYALIHGSPALARPTGLFSGSWNFDHSLVAKQAPVLNAFHAYCADLTFDDLEYRAEAFQTDLDRGLVFKSNLPIGYGVGSSGAVTAAIFDQYFKKPEALDPPQLKQILGRIESYFHGKSSGFDPLVCYLNDAIKLEGDKIIRLEAAAAPSDYAFFLLNTETPRKTEPLVKHYLQKHEVETAFRELITEELIPLNRSAIAQTLAGEGEALFHSMEMISRLQWRYFEAMIPANTKNIWADSLTTNNHRIKLCGAGGGGFLLGLSKNMEQTRQAVAPFECLEIK